LVDLVALLGEVDVPWTPASRAHPAPASIIAGVAPCWLCGAGWIVVRNRSRSW